MFDVVAPHQHQPPASVHGRGIDNGKTRHPPAIGVGTKPVGGESAYQPGHDADQRQDRHKREEKCKCLHSLSPANRDFFKALIGSGEIEGNPPRQIKAFKPGPS
jgi:hypothetical protein